MASRLPPYPAYRDSGLGWLPQLPAHWEVRRNGRLFAQRVETGREELPILEVSLRTGVRVRSFGEGGRKQVMADRAKYKRAAAGDIAYNMMRLWQGAVGVVPEDGLVSPAYVVAAPYEDVEPRYFAYLFRTADYMREVEGFSRGIVADRNRLYWAQFKQMPSPYPPLEEQRRIADYLDAHGRLTNRLIRNRRRLVGVLKERRQGIIQVWMTRGADPQGPTTATGLSWLPAVPAGWRVERLKSLVRPINEQTDPSTYNGRRIALEHVQSWTGVIKTDNEEPALDSSVKIFKTADILFGRLRPYLAKVALPDFDGVCVGEFLVLRAINETILPTFLHQRLRCADIIAQINASTFGAKMPRADWGFIGSLPIAYPTSTQDQEQIVEAITRDVQEIDKGIEAAEEMVRVLQELRERLIADAVTGALDVRAADIAAPVADRDEDSLALDDESDGAEDEAEDDLEAALAEAEE